MSKGCFNAPRISVLMPLYNAQAYVAKAIESILRQTYTDFELLILDDGSTDNSIDIVKSFRDKRIRFFRNEENRGVLVSSNYLFRVCKGQLITFQDADDWSEGNRLSLQEKEFAKDPHLRICGCQCFYVKGRRRHLSSFPLTHTALVAALEGGETSICCGASVMFCSGLIRKYGGYRSFFDRIGAEHLDFFWRMVAHERFVNLPAPLYNYRLNSSSFTQSDCCNPLRFYSTKLALLAYWQRKLTGVDFIGNNQHCRQITNMIMSPHLQDPSLSHSMFATTQLAFGNIGNFISVIYQSIMTYGLTIANMKSLVGAVPLFILCHFVPNKLQRYLVRKNNSRFLNQYGIDGSVLKDKSNGG